LDRILLIRMYPRSNDMPKLSGKTPLSVDWHLRFFIFQEFVIAILGLSAAVKINDSPVLANRHFPIDINSAKTITVISHLTSG